MKLTVTPEAVAWFKAEFNLLPQQAIHLFGKVYGKTAVHDGFSVGIEPKVPSEQDQVTQVESLKFFIEPEDEWFFADYDLTIEFDTTLNEPRYQFEAH